MSQAVLVLLFSAAGGGLGYWACFFAKSLQSAVHMASTGFVAFSLWFWEEIVSSLPPLQTHLTPQFGSPWWQTVGLVGFQFWTVNQGTPSSAHFAYLPLLYGCHAIHSWSLHVVAMQYIHLWLPCNTFIVVRLPCNIYRWWSLSTKNIQPCSFDYGLEQGLNKGSTRAWQSATARWRWYQRGVATCMAQISFSFPLDPPCGYRTAVTEFMQHKPQCSHILIVRLRPQIIYSVPPHGIFTNAGIML
jgi:hypothetical protein